VTRADGTPRIDHGAINADGQNVQWIRVGEIERPDNSLTYHYPFPGGLISFISKFYILFIIAVKIQYYAGEEYGRSIRLRGHFPIWQDVQTSD
jgi:hypothetical protein